MAWKTPVVSGEAEGVIEASMGPRFNGVEDHRLRIAMLSLPEA